MSYVQCALENVSQPWEFGQALHPGPMALVPPGSPANGKQDPGGCIGENDPAERPSVWAVLPSAPD